MLTLLFHLQNIQTSTCCGPMLLNWEFEASSISEMGPKNLHCILHFCCITLVLDDGTLLNFNILFLDIKGKLLLNWECGTSPVSEYGPKKGQFGCFRIIWMQSV